ncbi:MAG: VWA domain-containing protein [Deltaproteobacteria bacterium]|nr:VWA domain-containing protein [Deltaproteobacteria bacterium]MCB9490415.1 VWA domain-containing protein [Deltaproteobacteria bacterium]
MQSSFSPLHFHRRILIFLIAALLALSIAIACSSGDDDDDDDSADSSTDDDDDDYSDDDSADDDYSDDDYSDDDDDDYYDDDVDDDTEPDEVECPDTMDDTVLYLSADDSNSQASPVVARAIINAGDIMPRQKVRTYEFTNYYQIEYTPPESDAIRLVPQMRVHDNPDYDTEYTLQIGAQSLELIGRRAKNLVFSMDTSGSMEGRSITLLRDTARAIAKNLKQGDIVSIVEWDNIINVPLDSHEVSGPNDATLLAVIDDLVAGGSTDLHGGLVRAYELAQKNYDADRLNRVILISDGQANTGVTDIDIIAGAADDSEQQGIYLVGVGVGDASNYFYDLLMDDVTDAGKGAYIFIDSKQEAELQFGARFNENMDVAALDVRARLTTPYYLVLREFHGEEYSPNPEEVEPQHLGPNDAMVYHQFLTVCGPDLLDENDEMEFQVTWTDPDSLEDKSATVTKTIAELLADDADQLIKGDAIVAYAEALKQIDKLIDESDAQEALELCQATKAQVQAAADELNDAELASIADLLDTYEGTIENYL